MSIPAYALATTAQADQAMPGRLLWKSLAVVLFVLAAVALVMTIEKKNLQALGMVVIFAALGSMCIRQLLRSR